jgi:hypothetical protein
MTHDLWERSSEDIRERWRDIARALRETGDAEAIPRALQTCFWFGVENSRFGAGPRSEVTLRNLLPGELLAKVQAGAADR